MNKKKNKGIITQGIVHLNKNEWPTTKTTTHETHKQNVESRHKRIQT